MPEKPSSRSLQAPGSSTGASYELPADSSAPATGWPDPAGIRIPGRSERLAPDDRLARPEFGRFGEEVVDGVRMECMPSEAEHADPQCRLAHLAGACLAKGYVASTELLTRTDVESDFATDVCVRREGVDPKTGGRYLEEISFEVANTQTREELEKKRVPKLVRCGVRRIFVVLVPEGEVLEWSIRDKEWIGLAGDDEIRDPVFVQPLEVQAILDASAVDQLVSKAQLTKKEPHLMAVIKKREAKARTKGRAEGEARGLAEAILRVFDSHGITLDSENRQAILDCQDMALLKRLFDKALVAKSASAVLAELEKAD